MQIMCNINNVCVEIPFRVEWPIMTKENKNAHKERTDSCAVPAASIIAESMMCIVLADVVLEKFGGDSMKQLLKHIEVSAKY